MNSIIRPGIFREFPNVQAGISIKSGSKCAPEYGMNMSYSVGDDPANVRENRKIFFSQLGILDNQLAIPIQIHSNTVRQANLPGEYEECDALITDIKNVALTVTVADCVPIMLFDPVNCAIGIVHAGWRGTANEIALRAVESMHENYKSIPSKLRVFIGPAAGPCCYEMEEELAVLFRNKIVSLDEEKVYIDLKNENKSQLKMKGVLPDHIETSELCTICNKEVFHSFRRDGAKSGRMMAAICVSS
jgi:YfiH family protein